VAEWHITRQKDFDQWLWFGDNEKYNKGCPLPPSPIVYGWGRNIMPEFLPMFNKHKLDIAKIKQFQVKQESVSETDRKETEDWKKPFEMAKDFYAKGDIKMVIKLIQEATKAGLPKLEHAEVLGVIGDHYLLKGKDVETARNYYESSIQTHFSGYWVAHLMLGYMHEAEGDIQNAKRQYDDAKRANPHKQLDPAFEAKVRQIIRKWAKEKLPKSSKPNIDELIGKKDIEGLIKGLNDDDETIRWAAAKALGEVGDQIAIEPLIGALKDEEEDVRWYAAMSLGKIGDQRAINALTQCVEDKSKLVRQFSKNAVNEIKERVNIRTEGKEQLSQKEVDDVEFEDAVIDARQEHEDSEYQQLGQSKGINEGVYSDPTVSGRSQPRAAYGVKRKLTAILSADVKGYSLLMQEDEVATVHTLTEYRKLMSSLIEQFKGRVVDSPGDNLLAEFASVVDAAQCAMEIQQVLKAKNELLPENRRMEFRIGINLGDVIEEGERIYGDGVNIAARIESLAEAGGICISGSAYEQIENKLPLRYEYLGQHSVKNIRKQIKVYRALIGPKLPPAVQRKKRVRLKRWQWAALSAGVAVASLIAVVVIRQNYLRPSPPPVEVSAQRPPVPKKGETSDPWRKSLEEFQALQESSMKLEAARRQFEESRRQQTFALKTEKPKTRNNSKLKMLLAEMPWKPSKMNSETYLFFPTKKRLKNAKILVLSIVKSDPQILKKSFEDKGVRIARMPQAEMFRALEVGVVDGVVTTSTDIVSSLRKKFPDCVALSLYPEITLLD
jgi:class 3 adenylate cyclase